VGGLAFHPAEPDTWYMRTFPWRKDEQGRDFMSQEGGIAVTHDDGGSFEYIDVVGTADDNSSIKACPSHISIAPNGSTLYVADPCGYGLFRSTDDGETWDRVSEAFPDQRVNAVAVDPSEPSEVWAATEIGDVYRSGDGGGSWTRVDGGLGFRGVSGFAMSEHDPGTVFASLNDVGVVRSTDDGQTWSLLPSGMASRSIADLKIDSTGRVIAATRGDGVVALEPV